MWACILHAVYISRTNISTSIIFFIVQFIFFHDFHSRKNSMREIHQLISSTQLVYIIYRWFFDIYRFSLLFIATAYKILHLILKKILMKMYPHEFGSNFVCILFFVVSRSVQVKRRPCEKIKHLWMHMMVSIMITQNCVECSVSYSYI